ncbi:Amino-acid permease inda1 [Microsporum audouinii]
MATEKTEGVSMEETGPGLPPFTSSDSDMAVEEKGEELGFWTRLGCTPESFKRRRVTGGNQLNQTLKSRHLHMIAIGGSIGAGLFVGSGSALAKGGPASLVIDFAIIGIMMFNVVHALGELAILFPVSGGFYTYSARFISPAWGFAMGWNYVFQWLVVLPLELTVTSLTITYWKVNISVAVWITVFLVAIIIINIFGVLGYGEEEFWASAIKLTSIVIFMITAIVLTCGGGPKDGLYGEYWGARLWYDPGAFRNGFKGFCSVFVTAAFAFFGTELVGLAAAESKTPLKSLPSAIKQVFWRIILFYILGLFFIGILVRSDDKRLLGANTYTDSNASPFVIAAKDAGLRGFDSFINVIILISVLSIGNSAVYAGSRTLTAISEHGYAPRIFSYVDKAGRPLFSTILVIVFGGLAYVNVSGKGPVIFDWLQALSGLTALFTWGSICYSHIRFRAAWALHGRSLDEIPFKSYFGVYGSYLGLIIIFIVFIAQFYIAVSPLKGEASAEGFFKSYLALPVVLFFWFCGWLWKREGWTKIEDIDIDTGRREIDWEEHNRRMELIKQASFLKRLTHRFF